MYVEYFTKDCGSKRVLVGKTAAAHRKRDYCGVRPNPSALRKLEARSLVGNYPRKVASDLVDLVEYNQGHHATVGSEKHEWYRKALERFASSGVIPPMPFSSGFTKKHGIGGRENV